MGYILKIPKPLITPSPSSPSPSPTPLPPHKPPTPMLYYSIVLVATAAIVLGIYNLIIIRLCTIQYRRHHRRYPETPNNTISPVFRPISHGGSTACLISSFKYKRAAEGGHKDCQLEYEMECTVCLSVLEEGEEVKRLPMCHHCFHASCIDMWLYSHIHCPLCRAPVVEPPPPPPAPATTANVRRMTEVCYRDLDARFLG